MKIKIRQLPSKSWEITGISKTANESLFLSEAIEKVKQEILNELDHRFAGDTLKAIIDIEVEIPG